MKTITENGLVYELREITDIKVYNMSKKIKVGIAKCPYDGIEVSFYITGSNCVTSDVLGDKFAGRYCMDGKYYSRSSKVIK